MTPDDKLYAENLTLKTCLLQAQNACLELTEKIKSLEQRLKESDNVIEFYANTDNWMWTNKSMKHSEISNDCGDVLYFGESSECGGKRAREYQQKYIENKE